MQVYFLGNPIEKRRKLMSIDGAIYLDNEEVVAVYARRGRLCFVVGRQAFLNFTVWQYLSYTKSLELRRPLKKHEANEYLAKVGLNINVNKRLKSFDTITQKAVRLAAILKPDTAKIALNFDGMKFSRKKHRRVQKLLAALGGYELSISVSDIRFVPSGADVWWSANSPREYAQSRIIKKGKAAAKLPAYF